MESQPQNPEFRINPENFHPWHQQMINHTTLNFFMNGINFVCLFDLILYVPSKIFQLNRDGSSWVEPVLS